MGTSEHDKRYETPVRAEIRGAIAQMEEDMQEPEFNHAGTPIETAIWLMEDGFIDTFADFERALRNTKSRVHLFAIPRESLESQSFDTQWLYLPIKERRVVVGGEVPAERDKVEIRY